MNWHTRLAALFVVLALTGCAQGITGQAVAPNAPISQENNGIRPEHGGGDGGGGGGSIAGEARTVIPLLRPASLLNARATAGFKVDLG
jgi:hypothetical protein